MGPPIESEYGEPTPPQDAPEAISKAVASLPPEQMFELMKQMKVESILRHFFLCLNDLLSTSLLIV